MNSNRINSANALFLLSLFILALAGAVYIGICTQFAPWGFSDSTAYFSAARNLAAGKELGLFNPDGSFTPLNLHAPLYPLILSPFAALRIDLIKTSRALDILLWFVTVFLSGWLFEKITSNRLAAFSFALITAFSFPLVTNFTSLMSEPLAFAFGIPGLLLVILAVKKNTLKLMLVAGLLCGLALLARFAFAAVPLAGVLIILLLSGINWQKRIRNILFFGAVSSTPMLAWMLIQLFENVVTGARSYSLSGSIYPKVREFGGLFINTLKYWLPYRSNMIPGVSADLVKPVLLALLVLIVAAGFVIAIRYSGGKVTTNPAFLVSAAMLIYLVCYTALLFFAFAFSSVPSDVNDRTLAPLMPGIFGLLLGACAMLEPGLRRKVVPILLTAVITLTFVVFNIEPLRAYAVTSSSFPEGYASPDWRGNPIFSAIDHLPADIPLASNAPDIVLFYTNRSSYYLTQAAKQGKSSLSILDQNAVETFLKEKCGMLILLPSSAANRYQRLPDPITERSISALEDRYSARYSAIDGTILYWIQCIN